MVEFSDNIRTAHEQLKQQIDQLYAESRPKRPDSESPMSLDERKCRVNELCDTWMAHALDAWSGPIDKDGHEQYRYTPPTYLTDKLAQILLWR